jgi:hypothetical protein
MKMAVNYKSMFDQMARGNQQTVAPATTVTPNRMANSGPRMTVGNTISKEPGSGGGGPSPSMITQSPSAGAAQNPIETKDYRELLNKQLMTESSKAQASKYLTAAMQASGVAGTGLAQSVLSGIDMGYSNMAASNVAAYNMLQQEQQFQSEQATLAQQSSEQSAVAEIAFSFLEGATDRESLQRYYDEYYDDLSPEQQRAFDLLYSEKQSELQFTGEATQDEILAARDSFNPDLPDDNVSYVSNDAVLAVVNRAADSLFTEGASTQSSEYQNAQNLIAILQASANWGAERNGTVYLVRTSAGDSYYGFHNGRWYQISGFAEGNATRIFNLK